MSSSNEAPHLNFWSDGLVALQRLGSFPLSLLLGPRSDGAGNFSLTKIFDLFLVCSALAMSTFATLEPALHPLLLRALSSLQFPTPTPIQLTLIPLALSASRDLLARARTGSGKTLAYAIPIVQGILQRRDRGETGGTRALILVPTRELAEQVRGQVGKLVEGLGLGEGEGISVVNVAGNEGGRKKRKNAGGERVERYGGIAGGRADGRQYAAGRQA